MRKIRWGVLSTARIGTEKVIPAMQRGTYTEVVAIASRDLETARRAADRLGIPHAFGSYEELLVDPAVDAIYNPLPNHLHLPWSLRTLAAGKHLLCEKPIGLTAEEAEELARAAGANPGLKVMEAFMYRHHPQWERAQALVRSGAIGDLRSVHASFSYFNRDPDDIRNIPEIGGGGLLDIGCYCISVSRFLFDAEPRRVSGRMERDPDFGTDRLTSGLLEFEEGTGTFTCSTQLAPHQRVIAHGTEGVLEIELPFTPRPDHSCRIVLIRGDTREVIVLDPTDQYTIQGDRFSRAILEGTPPPTPLDDAVATMRVIDAIAESSRSGRWVELGRVP
jgi:predicted dehydrogenase